MPLGTSGAKDPVPATPIFFTKPNLQARFQKFQVELPKPAPKPPEAWVARCMARDCGWTSSDFDDYRSPEMQAEVVEHWRYHHYKASHALAEHHGHTDVWLRSLEAVEPFFRDLAGMGWVRVSHEPRRQAVLRHTYPSGCCETGKAPLSCLDCLLVPGTPQCEEDRFRRGAGYTFKEGD